MFLQYVQNGCLFLFLLALLWFKLLWPVRICVIYLIYFFYLWHWDYICIFSEFQSLVFLPYNWCLYNISLISITIVLMHFLIIISFPILLLAALFASLSASSLPLSPVCAGTFNKIILWVKLALFRLMFVFITRFDLVYCFIKAFSDDWESDKMNIVWEFNFWSLIQSAAF